MITKRTFPKEKLLFEKNVQVLNLMHLTPALRLKTNSRDPFMMQGTLN